MGLLACACILSLAAAGLAFADTDSKQPSGLGAGRVGDYLWTVEAKRQEGGGPSASRPCLLVGTKWQTGPLSFRRSRSRQCADPSGLVAVGPPLAATGTQPGSGGAAGLTAVGMIFAPAARRVEATLGNGRRMTIRLHRSSPAQAREAGLGRFRYAAFAVHGVWCAERLVSENAAGRTLWDSGLDSYYCRDEG